MDNFVSNKLKSLGKDYFLTEFNAVNATSQPISFDLFNSNTIVDIPTSPAPVLPPTVISNTVNFNAISYVEVNYTNYNLYCVGDILGNSGIYVLDFNGSIVQFIPAPLGISIQRLKYNPINNSIYACTLSGSNTEVLVIDCNTNSIVSTINCFFGTINIEYNSISNSMYVALNDSTYCIIDCSVNSIIFTSGVLAPFINIQCLAFNANNNTMYLALGDDTVRVLNCNNQSIITIIPLIGISPVAIQYNPQSNSMYCTCLGSFLLNGSVDVIDCTSNTVTTNINIGGNLSSSAYNSILNLIYVVQAGGNIYSIDCNSNTASFLDTVPNAQEITYNYLYNTNYISAITDLSFQAPAQVTTTYIGGSSTYNYNTFIQDKASNPFLVNSVMLYSNNPSNLNQVFFATVKDATGEITYDPKLPALDISPNQFQASVTYVDFGKKGFVFNEQSSFSDFTVQPFSSVRIVLIQKQFNSNSEFTNPKSNMDAIMNDIGLYPIPNPDKTKIVRDSVRAVPLNTPTPTPAPKPTKKKKPLKPNKCAELWKDNYGIDGSEEINLQNQKSEILGMTTKLAVGLGVGILAVVGGIIFYKSK